MCSCAKFVLHCTTLPICTTSSGGKGNVASRLLARDLTEAKGGGGVGGQKVEGLSITGAVRNFWTSCRQSESETEKENR